MVVATWLEYTLGGVLGVAVGFLGGFAGIGGAPFIVAGLTLMVGYDQHLAQGTTVAVMLGPMSLPGVLVMWDRVRLLKNYIAIGVCTYAVCSYVGAEISYLFNGDAMQQLFGIFIFILGMRNVIRGLAAARAEAKDAQNGVLLEETGGGAAAAADDDEPSSVVAVGGATAAAAAGTKSAKPKAAAGDDAEEEAADEEFVEVEMEREAEAEEVAVPVASSPADADADAGAEPAKPAPTDDDVVEVDGGHSVMNPKGLTYTGEPAIKFTYVAAAVMGCIVGTVGGLFGIGAGVLMVPIMTSFFHIHKDDARAISLGILCPPVSLGAVIAYQREGDIRWGMVALQFVAYMSTNRAGALVGKKVKPRMFGHVLGSTLAVLGVVLVALAADSCSGFCF